MSPSFLRRLSMRELSSKKEPRSTKLTRQKAMSSSPQPMNSLERNIERCSANNNGAEAPGEREYGGLLLRLLPSCRVTDIWTEGDHCVEWEPSCRVRRWERDSSQWPRDHSQGVLAGGDRIQQIIKCLLEEVYGCRHRMPHFNTVAVNNKWTP